MKLVFVHTAEKVKIDTKGNFYTDGAYDAKVWARYLRLCEEMVFIARRDTKNYSDKVLRARYNLIDTDQVKVELIEDTRESFLDFINLKKRLGNRKKIKNIIAQANKVIIRMPCAEGITAIQIAKKKRIDYLIECVGCIWDGLWNYSLKGKVLAPISYLLMRWSIYDAEYVLYVTGEFLQKRYPTTGQTINCSNVVLPETGDDILKRRLSQISQHYKGKKRLIIGTSAAIDVPYKGQEYVIRAISNLRKEGYIFQYQLIGAGNKERLQHLAIELGVNDQVDFMGSLKHEEVFTWLDSIDIYIQPSKQEGIPRALLEAMSRGCPAIGSKAGGIPEALPPTWIFEKGSVDQIESLLRSMNLSIMQRAAKTNFLKSKEYSNGILTNRRNSFFDKFVSKGVKVL